VSYFDEWKVHISFGWVWWSVSTILWSLLMLYNHYAMSLSLSLTVAFCMTCHCCCGYWHCPVSRVIALFMILIILIIISFTWFKFGKNLIQSCTVWCYGCDKLYRYAPQNDVLVNNGPHLRRWSHKMTTL